MGDTAIVVYRERLGAFQRVGKLEETASGLSFAYDAEYLAGESKEPLSASMPLSTQAFGHEATSNFFDGILPEGSARVSFAASFHVAKSDIGGLLRRLNNESVGAMVFKLDGEDPAAERGYEPLSEDWIVEFATSPANMATVLSTGSRLSLAGAQRKIGLRHIGDKDETGWYRSYGTAPATHIVKACDGSFPGQTINEALCMRTAEKLQFEVAECRLIHAGGVEPLLSIRRFDRVDAGGEYPIRLHQEDFCQALGWASSSKYEPTDGNYANIVAHAISKWSSNPMGDRRMFFLRLLFDWAVGNADNHLKNHSMLWSQDWSKRMLSPLYDIASTTVYPSIDREMGISLCPSRRIDDVTREDVAEIAKRTGVGAAFAMRELDELLETFLPALRSAADEIAEQGFPASVDMAQAIARDFTVRRETMVAGN